MEAFFLFWEKWIRDTPNLPTLNPGFPFFPPFIPWTGKYGTRRTQ